MKNFPARFVVALILLVATAAFLQAHKRGEVLPAYEKISTFPMQVMDYQGKDVPIDQSVLDILGKGEFLSRVYVSNTQPYVDFFIAYFPSQKTGDAVHSPKNCLPGSGWTPLESGFVTIAVPDRAPIKVNRYVIARGTQRNLVLYWYQSHGRAIASEYWAKIYQVTDSIRMNRTDAALVRIITPIAPNENSSVAEQRAVAFAKQIDPQLMRFIPN